MARVLGLIGTPRETATENSVLDDVNKRLLECLTARLRPAVRSLDCPGYWTVSAVSSITNDVCSEESSVPTNFSVMDWPT